MNKITIRSYDPASCELLHAILRIHILLNMQKDLMLQSKRKYLHTSVTAIAYVVQYYAFDWLSNSEHFSEFLK